MLARLEDDLLGLLLACAEGRLPEKVRLSRKTALAVVMAARGYPGTPERAAPSQASRRRKKSPA